VIKVGLTLCVLCLCCLAVTGNCVIAQEQPANIVLILADDLGYGELGCYGQQKIRTPNIDRLASQGVRFTQHYSGAPVCAPARCVLMTGQHLGHAEIRGNQQAKKLFPQFKEGQHPVSQEVVTLPMVLKQAGFVTGAFGKWGLGPVGSTGSPSAKGIDEFFGYNCQAVAHSYFPRHLWRNEEMVVINERPIPGAQRQPDGEVTIETWQGTNYAPALMIDEAEQFIGRHARERFFLYLPFVEPHVSLQPPLASIDEYPSDWDTQPYRGGNGYLPHPRPRAAYAAMISDLDRHVGRVLQSLEKHGLTEKTLVIFTSDNGATHEGAGEPQFHIGGADPKFFQSTSNLKGYKGSVYDGGIRVPMIAKLPGVIDAGSTNETPCYFADWFPTLCAAVAVTPPENLDGTSLWKTITSNSPLERTKPMLWFYPEYGGQVAVRLGDWKIVRRGLKTKQPGRWEVYHIVDDPSEAHDLAPTHPELIQQAIDILQREVTPNPVFPMEVPTDLS
jgi:arylsulfatase A